MNNSDRVRIRMHSMHLLNWWVELIDQNDSWKNRHRQAFYDALTSMKHCGLIKDFSIEGIIYPDNQAITLADWQLRKHAKKGGT